MRRETPSLALLLVGAWVLKVSLSDDYKVYVKDSFGPWLAAAGALLVLAALVGLYLALRPDGGDHAHDHDADEVDDGHGHGKSYVGWLLLAPLVVFALVAPRPLGSYSAARAAAPPPPPASQNFDALPAGDPVSISLRDYTSRALWGGGDTLEGRTVTLTGFVTPRAEGGYYITRLVIACCAADALPVQVYVSGDAAGVQSKDSWVAVTGTLGEKVRDDTDAYDIATIEATSIAPVAAPASSYEQ